MVERDGQTMMGQLNPEQISLSLDRVFCVHFFFKKKHLVSGF